MLQLTFTVEETNLIAIYKADTLASTIDNFVSAFGDITDNDIAEIAESASLKLAALTEPEFTALSFTLTDEDDENDEGGAYE
jgi:hypothetical protein